MTTNAGDVNTWHQPQMFPADIYEITLRIGVMPMSDHCQIQLDVVQQPEGDLLAMRSVHHCSIEQIQGHVDDFHDHLRYYIEFVLDPFRNL